MRLCDDVLFFMTRLWRKQRTEVTARFPDAVAKTYCLHPDTDVSFPHAEKSAHAFSDMAREIQELIGRKLDALGISRVGGGFSNSSSIRLPRRSSLVSRSADAEEVIRLP